MSNRRREISLRPSIALTGLLLAAVGVLAIFSSEAQEKYIPHSSAPGINKSVILEFEVADVDKEFARLQGMVKNWVKPPTNQPWGTRSFYFRDPDGDLVHFFNAGSLGQREKEGELAFTKSRLPRRP